MFSPVFRGWINYYGNFHKSALYPTLRHLNRILVRWAKWKFNREETRLIEFGRFAEANRAERGEGKPETFDFLGFTHICSRTQKGNRFTLRRKTIAKRLRTKLKEVREAIIRRRHEPVPALGKWLRSVIQGHLNYFAVPGNRKAVDRFRTEINRAWLFALRRRSQKSRFISKAGILAQETGTRILAWTLMRNHVHPLFFSGPPGISKFMRRLLTGYALRYNRRHRRNGHLFQNRYKSIVCEEGTYLLELVRYIHLNPVRASQVKSMVE